MPSNPESHELDVVGLHKIRENVCILCENVLGRCESPNQRKNARGLEPSIVRGGFA